MTHLLLLAAAAAAACLLVVQMPLCVLASDADNEVALLRHLKNISKTYGSTVVPRHSRSENVTVQFVFLPKQLLSVNAADQTVQVAGIVYAVWADHLLVWNKSDFGGIDLLYHGPKRLWKPAILIHNSASDRQLLRVNGEVALNSLSPNSTLVSATWYGQFTFSCDFKMATFPVDAQVCQLQLMATVFGEPGGRVQSLAVPVPRSARIAFFSGNNEWKLTHFTSKNDSFRLLTLHGEPYEAHIFVAEFHLARRHSYYVIVMYIPLVLLTILQLLTYLLPLESGEKIGCGITVMLSYTVFLLLLDNMVPKSEQVPVIVTFIMLSMVVASASLVYNALLIRMHYTCSYTRMPRWMQLLLVRWLGCLTLVRSPSSSSKYQSMESRATVTASAITGSWRRLRSSDSDSWCTPA